MKRLIIAGLSLLLSVSFAAVSMAAETTVTGHLRDSFCNTVMGAQGPSHKKCAIACAKKGIPVVLVSKDDKAFVLLPPKNNESLPESVISKMEDEVTVSGKEYHKYGISYLTVESIK